MQSFELTFHLEEHNKNYFIGTLSLNNQLVRGIIADGISEMAVVEELKALFTVKVNYDLQSLIQKQSKALVGKTKRSAFKTNDISHSYLMPLCEA